MVTPVRQSGVARTRIIAAALRLFTERGVDGTSLQTIADDLGMLKASVYYQFHTKDDLVLAVVRPMFAEMALAVKAAEEHSSPLRRREAAMRGLIDLVVRNRNIGSLLYNDHAVLRIIRSDIQYNEAIEQMRDLLIGSSDDTESRVTVTMVAAGVFGCSDARNLLADISDQHLHRILADRAARLLALTT